MIEPQPVHGASARPQTWSSAWSPWSPQGPQGPRTLDLTPGFLASQRPTIFSVVPDVSARAGTGYLRQQQRHWPVHITMPHGIPLRARCRGWLVLLSCAKRAGSSSRLGRVDEVEAERQAVVELHVRLLLVGLVALRMEEHGGKVL